MKPIEPFPQERVRTIIGDIAERETLEQILVMLPRKADVVLSDASPNISGIWEVDHARQIDLALQAMEIALQVLNQSGSFFVKVFQGDMLNDYIKKMQEHFNVVRVIKPKASRAKSSEIFVLGTHPKNNRLGEQHT